MSDLQKYIAKRSQRDAGFSEGFEVGYTDFKIGVLLRQAREDAGLTQEQLATRMGTKKSAISRVENHAEDVRLSTLKAYAQAVGAKLHIQFVGA